MRNCSLLFIFIAFLFYGCEQKTQKGSGNPIIPEKDYPTDKEYTPDIPPPPAPYTGPKKYCFEKHEGENGENVTELEMVVDNDSITGRINYLPAHQAAIYGKVEGIMMGNVLNVVYSYSLEGVKHKEQMIYKFDSDKLFKKTGEMIEQEGMLILREPSKADFLLSMDRVKCK